jgi:predicted RNase H-like HicB family nuclease
MKKSIELTGVFIKDDDNNFTGFFSEFPEAVSQGDSFEEAEKKLFEVLPDILELKKKMSEEDIPEGEIKNVFKKAYSFQPA